MCSDLACRTITMRQWPSVGCLDSWMRHMLTTKPTTNTHQLRTNTALWASSWHFSHKLYITAHKRPRTPLEQPMLQLPAHPTVLSTATFHCHNYSNCPPTLKPSAALHDQCACALTQTRPTCTVVVTKRKESRRGEGNSLSFDCVLATLKLNTLSCTPNLWVHTANYYFPHGFFFFFWVVLTKY